MSHLIESCVTCDWEVSKSFIFSGYVPLSTEFCPKCQNRVLCTVTLSDPELNYELRKIYQGGRLEFYSDIHQQVDRILKNALHSFLGEYPEKWIDGSYKIVLNENLEMNLRPYAFLKNAGTNLPLKTTRSLDAVTTQQPIEPPILAAEKTKKISTVLEDDLQSGGIILTCAILDNIPQSPEFIEEFERINQQLRHGKLILGVISINKVKTIRVTYEYFFKMEALSKNTFLEELKYCAKVCLFAFKEFSTLCKTETTLLNRDAISQSNFNLQNQLAQIELETIKKGRIRLTELKDKVYHFLAQAGIDPTLDPNNNLTFLYNSALTRVTFNENEADTFITISSKVLSNIEVDEQLLRAVLLANNNCKIGLFKIFKDEIRFEYTLLGNDLDFNEFIKSLVHTALLADEYDDKFQAVSGGLRGIDQDAAIVGPGVKIAMLVAEVMDGKYTYEKLPLTQVQNKVLQFLQELKIDHNPVSDTEQEFYFGTTRVRVIVSEDQLDSYVTVKAEVLYNCQENHTLIKKLIALNNSMVVGGFKFCYQGAQANVICENTLFASDLDLNEIAKSLFYIAKIADDYDEELQKISGGLRAFDLLNLENSSSVDMLNDLILQLKSGITETDKIFSAKSLVNYRDNRAIDALVDSLNEASDELTYWALNSLVQIGRVNPNKTSFGLINMALNPDASVASRLSALKGLRYFYSSEAADSLMPLLRDENAQIRGGVIQLINRLGLKVDLEAIQPLLEDKDETVIVGAIALLSHVTSQLKGIIPIFEQIILKGSPRLKEAVFQVLSTVKPYGLYTALKFANSKEPETLLGICRVIQAMGTKNELPFLTRLLKTNQPSIVLTALDTIEKIFDPDILPSIKQLLMSHSDYQVRLRAIQLLGSTNLTAAIPILNEFKEIETHLNNKLWIQLIIDEVETAKKENPIVISGIYPLLITEHQDESLEWLEKFPEDKKAELLHSEKAAHVLIDTIKTELSQGATMGPEVIKYLEIITRLNDQTIIPPLLELKELNNPILSAYIDEAVQRLSPK